jgi:serine-type D-Ala-D-Ala endopeptidase (penicillin-binding protein 7)
MNSDHETVFSGKVLPGMTLRLKIAVMMMLCSGISANLFARTIPSLRAPKLKSAAFLIKNQRTDELLLSRRADTVLPIASITKLMTAMVTLDARLDMNEMLTIEEADKDTIRNSHSRLFIGTRLSRREALLVALMASDNRAAHALARTYPSGIGEFVKEMNRKARELGLTSTRFAEPTGLSEANVSSALDLSRLAAAAYRYPQIRTFTTEEDAIIQDGRKQLHFSNTNALVGNSRWSIGLSKTGYTEDSGRCLVMQAQMAGEPILLVLLDSDGKNTRIGDANRIRDWLEGPKPVKVAKKRRKR